VQFLEGEVIRGGGDYSTYAK